MAGLARRSARALPSAVAASMRPMPTRHRTPQGRHDLGNPKFHVRPQAYHRTLTVGTAIANLSVFARRFTAFIVLVQPRVTGDDCSIREAHCSARYIFCGFRMAWLFCSCLSPGSSRWFRCATTCLATSSAPGDREMAMRWCAAGMIETASSSAASTARSPANPPQTVE